MISIENYILLTILTPLIVSITTPFLAKRTLLRDLLGPTGGLISFWGSIQLAGSVLNGETPSIEIIQVAEGLSIGFKITPLGAIFGLVASCLWIFAAIYSVGYMRGNNEKNQTRFFTFYALAIHAALCIAYAGDLLTLFIFYEILTFSTYPLVTHNQNDQARNAGRLYMGILVGTPLILLLPAIIWVWIITGSLEMSHNGILAGKLDPKYAPYLLLMFAFGIGKAALMPFHKWLPAAMVAPTPVSALLHAVAVVKAGVFTMLVVLTNVFGIDYLTGSGASIWLIAVASFTLLTSSIIAITKDDLKARLAYSTISQLSYIVLGGALATSLAVQGAAMHIIMHAAGKITLFFVAGAIYVGAKLTKISDLDGQGYKMPWMFAAFFIGSLSIIGVPPLGGSWSKFLLMLGAVDSGFIIVIFVLCISTFLNVYYLLEIPARAFFKSSKKEINPRIPILAALPPIFTAVITVLLFFYPHHLKTLTEMMVIQ